MVCSHSKEKKSKKSGATITPPVAVPVSIRTCGTLVPWSKLKARSENGKLRTLPLYSYQDNWQQEKVMVRVSEASHIGTSRYSDCKTDAPHARSAPSMNSDPMNWFYRRLFGPVDIIGDYNEYKPLLDRKVTGPDNRIKPGKSASESDGNASDEFSSRFFVRKKKTPSTNTLHGQSTPNQAPSPESLDPEAGGYDTT